MEGPGTTSGVLVSPSLSPTKPIYGTPGDFMRAIDEIKASLAGAAPSETGSPQGSHISSWCTRLRQKMSREQLKIVSAARKCRMPIVPCSGGTRLEGHFTGWKGGGICVDIPEMDKIMAIHGAFPISAFVSNVQLDPGPTVTLGAGTNSSPSNSQCSAVRYGEWRPEWFLNATVVLPSGEVIKMRRRSRKLSAGFDTTKLFVGAEGTSGIVTEVTIRLAPIVPTTVVTARFPDVCKASEAVIEILNMGIGVRASFLLSRISDPYSTSRPECIRVELVDAAFMRVTMTTGNPAREYDIADHLEKHGGDKFWPTQSEEAAAMWTDRKNTHYSGLAYAGECAKGGRETYGIVPISKLPQLVYETQKDIERSRIMYFVLGHAGDGNFHTFLAFKTDEELKTVRGLVHRMVKRVPALDGTYNEHGIGIKKKDFLVEELGTGTVAPMKTIEQAVDPLGIMNPGKLYPDDGATPDS
ncbi:FAD-binding domain-containing protein [Lactarius sanguifluus]|nr:FAD-binding domain-containing protein [Lactarius sanguifluus]